jgi:hypothetical protein
MPGRARAGTVSRAARIAALAGFVAAVGTGCGQRLDVGSDLLWTGLFEGANFDEWMGDNAGTAQAFPAPPNVIEISTERVHHGAYAAKLTIDAAAGGSRASAVLTRAGTLPVEAFYSAWYYVPRSVTVGDYWVIFKFRQQDQSTMDELYDLDLINLPTGEMSLLLYDHRLQGNVALDVTNPVVPVGQWFQIEAFYRNAQDDSGRLTFWLDGRPIVDIANQPMAPTPWVEWDASSIAQNLNPSTAVLYIDDCAVSRARVGPLGIIEPP